MKIVNCVVRYDSKQNELVLFYYDERNDLVCFTKSEGHSQASYEWYLNTDYIRESFPTHEDALKLVEFYNTIDSENDPQFKLVKRLVRN